jgi:MFS family permease
VLAFQQFLEGFVPIAALYAIMFERVGGLSLEQIGLLFSIWSLAYVAAELPTGVLADYWSRRNVIILGGLLRCAGFVIWMLWPSFAGYAIGFALWGVMIACTSGAAPAYLQEELKAVGKGGKFAKYFGWTMSALSAGMLSGYLVAGLLTLEYMNVLIGLGVVSSVLFSLVLLATPESPYKRQDTYLKTLAAGFKEIARSKRLRYVCYGLFSVFMIIGVLEELLPRLFAQFGLNDSGVSLVLAASLIATIVLLAKLEAFARLSMAKQLLLMCLGLVFLAVGLRVGGMGASVFLLIFSLIFHVFRPVFMHHVQESTEGNERATIGSIPGLAAGLLGAAAYAVIGKVAGLTSERWSIAMYAAFWLLVLVVLIMWGRKYDQGFETQRTGHAEVASTSQPSTQF